MKIDEKGIELSTINDILDAYELQLQSKYGADFHIKPEGIIDNIANSAGFMEMSLQDQIAFLAKQFDPETAEGDWQDALYERIGVRRIAAQPTIFKKGIVGIAGFAGSARTITIRSTRTGDEFINSASFAIEDTGIVKVDFECLATGETVVNPDDTFQIVEAPNEITGIFEEDATDIAAGRGRETDDEYKLRFRNAKAQNAKATRNANSANLLQYVDNIAFLKLIDKKTDNTFEPGTLLTIVKHNTTNEIFARALFETVADGIDLLGDTSVVVKDNAGQDVTITFKNANEPKIYLNAIVKIRDGYYPNTVFANAKQNILAYIQRRVFGLQSIIYATEFIIPILETDGVEAVTSIQVRKGNEGGFVDNVQLERDEAPAFELERIVLSEPE